MPRLSSRHHHLRNALPALLATLAPLLVACGQNPSTPHRPQVSFRLTSGPRLPLRLAADLVIKKVQFGILETNAAGEENFVPTREIPPDDGQAFGWVVEVDTTRESLHWQEHLKLPQPPADWGDAATDEDVIIAADGRSAVAQGDDMIEDGELSRFYWTLAAGDPAGEYEMDVAVEGRSVAHFSFHVPRAVQEKAVLVRNRAPSPRSFRRVLVRMNKNEAVGASAWR